MLGCIRSNNFIALLLIILITLTSTTTFCKDMIIFGYDSKPPKYYIENGEPKGILVDMMRWIGKEIHYNFDIRLYPWKRAYHHALEGDGGIIGLSWNAKREKIFDIVNQLNEGIPLINNQSEKNQLAKWFW